MESNRRLVTIGTGSGVAVPGKGGSAILVQIGHSIFLLDCGEGVAGWVNYFKLTSTIEYIFITHLHPDHISGLFVLIQNMYLAERSAPLVIYMPEEGIKPAKQMLSAMYLDPDFKKSMFKIQFSSIQQLELLKDNSFIIRAWPSDHFNKDEIIVHKARPAFGFTIETSNNRLVYTGDVASIDCFTKELIPGTTLICEAAHISSEAVLKMAGDSGVNRVIFIHIDPLFTGLVAKICKKSNIAIIANDGMEFEW